MSKKQTSYEGSKFESEFYTMKQVTKYVHSLCYKLPMMGIPCSDPKFIYGDNQSILKNTSVPSSQLKKKSNSIAYHFVYNRCTRNEWQTAYVNTHVSPVDLLTKLLPSGDKRNSFIRRML